MTITHIVGKPRMGKGILATKLALGIADDGGLVDCNYHLKDVAGDGPHPRANYIDFFELLTFLKKPRCEPPHTLVLDELSGWCDSYVSQSKSSRFASHFVNQSAKLGYDLIFTTQRSMRADINYRELADSRFRAEKKAACLAPKCPANCEGLPICHFKYVVLDPDVTNEDVETGKSFKMTFAQASVFWNRFETFEAVPPVGLDELLSEMQKHDPARLNDEINRQVDELIPMWEIGEKPDFVAVQSALVAAGLPTVHARLVAYRLSKCIRQGHTIRPQIETRCLPVEIERPLSGYLEGWRRLQNRKG